MPTLYKLLQCIILTYSRISNGYESLDYKIEAEYLVLWRLIFYTNRGVRMDNTTHADHSPTDLLEYGPCQNQCT